MRIARGAGPGSPQAGAVVKVGKTARDLTPASSRASGKPASWGQVECPCLPCGQVLSARGRGASRLETESFIFVVLYSAPEARRGAKKCLHVYTLLFYDSKGLRFYSQLQLTARPSKHLRKCTYKGA